MANSQKKMGSLEAITVLHGWSYDTEKWRPFITALDRRGISAHILSIPGLTASIPAPWMPSDYVSWLDRSISKDKQPVTLLGHSNGGRIALWYTLSHPERIRRLILIDSAGIYHNDIVSIVKRKVFGVLAKTGKRLTNSRALRTVLYKLARVEDYNSAAPAMKKTMVNLITGDRALQLERVAVPTFLIWGTHDEITPLSDAYEMHTRIPHSNLTVISNARHAPQFTEPNETAEAVYRVLHP